MPITEPATKVDQFREFWTSLGRSSTEPTSARQVENFQPSLVATETPNILDTDVRDIKIAELYKQLRELERRTKPTRTSLEGPHHSGIDPIKPKIIPPVKAYINVPDKPIIEHKKITHPPGFNRNDRSEYGTPEGSTMDFLGIQHPSPQRRQPDDWELNLAGFGGREINLRILKRLDRQAVLDHDAAMAAAPPVTFDVVADVPDIIETSVPDVIETHVPDLTETSFPDLVESVRNKKPKKDKKTKFRTPPSSPTSSSSSSSSPACFHRAAPPKIPNDIDKHQPVTVRVREAETIKLSPLPEAPYWEGWRQQMYDDMAAASGVGHDIVSWLHIVQASATTFESLSDSQSHPTLDFKLSSALRKLPKRDLDQQVQTRAKALERFVARPPDSG